MQGLYFFDFLPVNISTFVVWGLKFPTFKKVFAFLFLTIYKSKQS